MWWRYNNDDDGGPAGITIHPWHRLWEAGWRRSWLSVLRSASAVQGLGLPVSSFLYDSQWILSSMNLCKHVDINRPHMYPCSIIIFQNTTFYLFLLKKYIFIYLAALGLSYLMWDLLCFFVVSCCGAWTLELWCADLVALGHVGS